MLVCTRPATDPSIPRSPAPRAGVRRRVQKPRWIPSGSVDRADSRLAHAGEDGATEAGLMNFSGHEDRRTRQRYLKPSKEGTHRRLD